MAKDNVQEVRDPVTNPTPKQLSAAPVGGGKNRADTEENRDAHREAARLTDQFHEETSGDGKVEFEFSYPEEREVVDGRRVEVPNNEDAFAQAARNVADRVREARNGDDLAGATVVVEVQHDEQGRPTRATATVRG